MKDYSVLNGMIENQKSELRTAYDKGYNQCVKDFNLILEARKKEEEGYNRGVNDLWESVCKFMDADIVSDKEIWGCTSWDKFAQLSPSEVIERLKEYDEKHNCIDKICNNCKYSDNGMAGGNKQRCASCYYDEQLKGNTLFEPMETDSKIEVGDEVRGGVTGDIGIVTKVKNDGTLTVILSDGNVGRWHTSVCKPTGNHCDGIVNMLKELEEKNA